MRSVAVEWRWQWAGLDSWHRVSVAVLPPTPHLTTHPPIQFAEPPHHFKSHVTWRFTNTFAFSWTVIQDYKTQRTNRNKRKHYKFSLSLLRNFLPLTLWMCFLLLLLFQPKCFVICWTLLLSCNPHNSNPSEVNDWNLGIKDLLGVLPPVICTRDIQSNSQWTERNCEVYGFWDFLSEWCAACREVGLN